MILFPKDKVVGIFRGFSKGGMEFHAEIILPYRNEFQSIPMHGQFLLIQLESENEAVLGRITSLSSEGRLASSPGEDYGLRAVADDRPIPEDLRQQYLKYRVDVRVLGVIRIIDEKIIFAPSHRRLPHVGSKVAFLSNEIIKEIAGHNLEGVEIGYFALGEFIYSGRDNRLAPLPWMRIQNPAVIPRFPVQNLVSRRTFVFARAGFGKSNLNKLLFSNLYKETPVIEKRGGKTAPVGTIIFDPDGEYYWPDDKNRPGLCDVPELEDKIVVFTKKTGPSPFYNSFVASDIRFDIRRFKASDVVSIALAPEKQEQQNVRKLRGLSSDKWAKLVDLIHKDENYADGDEVKKLLGLDNNQDVEMNAARANMTSIVRMLHDPGSLMWDMLLNSLKEGKLCIIDVSQLRGEPALILSGLILQRIFEYNQDQFTRADPKTIPTIAVVEEAQSVLGNTKSFAPYVSWVKEGRKYDLGAVLITQQPGSISNEILSQGDNWFTFHLISAGDLQALKKANAHFSDDILSSLLNEPIVGNGVFWSSAGGTSYPIPIRVMSFEQLYEVQDPEYNLPEAETFARILKNEFSRYAEISENTSRVENSQVDSNCEEKEEDVEEDYFNAYVTDAIKKLKNDVELISKIEKRGMTWRGIVNELEKRLPDFIDPEEKNSIAYSNVKNALDILFGSEKWDTEKRPSKSGSGQTLWVFIKNK
ncbi:hypothetical protein MSHOH_1708 [Methanosarcina horonobensis HB-1 = JCM 15518]|uniref:Helicase HerA central domain-containing protein n=2 Tax=Methanosarcina horonobensis TaxID=418008 RepID=A0A0E3SBH4_9EURY|nr:hypothetical protein MSHOH_1708 [Methanosarcina horonobensis HB-1 = JCM 15518]